MASCQQSGDDGNVDLSGDDDVLPTQTEKIKRKERDNDDEGDSRVKKKMLTARSWVWNHFTKQEKNKNKCNCHYCGKVLACSSKCGTTSLKNHIEVACKAYKVWKNQSQTVLSPNHCDASGSVKVVSKVTESVIREATNEMLVLGELPLSFIESLAWKHFCNKAQLYRPVSRRTATRDIVEMYVKKREAMKNIFRQNKQRVSLTTDIWVSTTTGASYMVITAHFVDATWQLKKIIIGFKTVTDHKASTICNVLFECLDEWDIKRIFCITVDNATANTSAMTKLKIAMKKIGDDSLVLKGDYMHLRCASHILNLVVRDGLQEVDKSVAAIRNGIQFVRSLTNRLKAFDLRVETGKIKRGSLPLDVKTRWNSTYLMIEQALNFRVAFDKMEAEDKSYNDYFLEKEDGKKRVGPPMEDDWDQVERLVQILVLFYKSTLVLSASTIVTSHKLYAEIANITRNLTSFSTNEELDEGLRQKALYMLIKLEKYWNPFGEYVEMNKMVIVASVFDPRKKMMFAGTCFDRLYGKNSKESTDLTNDVYQILKDLYDEYNRANLHSRNSSGASRTSSQSQGNQYVSQDQATSDFCERTNVCGVGIEDMYSIYDEIVKETVGTSSNELELYLNENVETPKLLKGVEFNVLSWWKANSTKYPVMSQIAKDILAMQVSSVASESAFSTSGRLLDPYRSCLTHYMIEVLICTQQWLKCEIHINEQGVSTIQQLLADVELEDELMREFEPEFTHLGDL